MDRGCGPNKILVGAAARATERRFRVNPQDTSGWFHTRRRGETASGFKVLIELQQVIFAYPTSGSDVRFML